MASYQALVRGSRILRPRREADWLQRTFVFRELYKYSRLSYALLIRSPALDGHNSSARGMIYAIYYLLKFRRAMYVKLHLRRELALQKQSIRFRHDGLETKAGIPFKIGELEQRLSCKITFS